jgi:nitrogen fixation/metabolism regulation signal transduction histidine kinase
MDYYFIAESKFFGFNIKYFTELSKAIHHHDLKPGRGRNIYIQQSPVTLFTTEDDVMFWIIPHVKLGDEYMYTENNVDLKFFTDKDRAVSEYQKLNEEKKNKGKTLWTFNFS